MTAPTLAIRWSETDGRRALAGRSQGRCEGCGRAGDLTAAHRARRSQGGSWSPTNLINLCGSGTTGCHGWAGHNPLLAEGLGWEIDGRTDPADVAAWLRSPEDPAGRAGWYLLRVELDAQGIRRHVKVPVEPEWIR